MKKLLYLLGFYVSFLAFLLICVDLMDSYFEVTIAPIVLFNDELNVPALRLLFTLQSLAGLIIFATLFNNSEWTKIKLNKFG